MCDATIQQLLDGAVVPVKHVEFKHKGPAYLGKSESAQSYKPIVKRTVTYIVMGLVFDDRGRMVMIQEAKMSCRGLWYIPAGRVEPGENFIDAMKREILEEAGLQVEPISLFYFTSKDMDTRIFMKLFFLNKVTGGELKTLDQQDEESLQAKWFTIEEIQSHLELRHKDFFEAMNRATWYRQEKDEARHPALQVGIQPHEHLLHRMVIVKHGHDGSLDVLCNPEQEFCLPCVRYSPGAHSLQKDMQVVVKSSFGDVDPTQNLQIKGLLTLEHCGIPAREHDGICITTITVIPQDIVQHLENTTPKLTYRWHSISNSDVLAKLKDRISSDNKLIQLISM